MFLGFKKEFDLRLLHLHTMFDAGFVAFCAHPGANGTGSLLHVNFDNNSYLDLTSAADGKCSHIFHSNVIPNGHDSFLMTSDGDGQTSFSISALGNNLDGTNYNVIPNQGTRAILAVYLARHLVQLPVTYQLFCDRLRACISYLHYIYRQRAIRQITQRCFLAHIRTRKEETLHFLQIRGGWIPDLPAVQLSRQIISKVRCASLEPNIMVARC